MLVVRILAGVVCAFLLLVPGLMMASIWTPVNLLVAFLAIIVSVLAAIWLPNWKWVAAVVTALLIAVPPYPYWLFSDNNGRWYFHFFHGFTLQKLPLPTFGFVFVVSLVLFAVIFWTVSGLRNTSARTGST